jgi:hypothetical protein
MRLNLLLRLFVSFLRFTTAIAATYLFASNLTLHEITMSTSAERVAAVVFGLNLTLAALMVYLMLRHAGRTPGLAADDIAEEELQAFAKERRSAVLLQAGATVVGGFLPLTAVIFYMAVSIFFIIDPLRHMRPRGRRPSRMKDEPPDSDAPGPFFARGSEQSPPGTVSSPMTARSSATIAESLNAGTVVAIVSRRVPPLGLGPSVLRPPAQNVKGRAGGRG